MMYNSCMDTQYAQLRIWRKTLKKLRLIAALTEQSVIASINQMADEKLKELRINEGEV